VRMRHIAICDLPLSIIFFYIIPQTARFSKKKVHQWIWNICFGFLYIFLSVTFLVIRRNEQDML
jgi:hypothetical protein